MSEVQRYSVAVFNGVGWADKDSDGDLVEYKDYSSIKAERDALAAENLALIKSRQLLGEFIIEEIKADYPLNLKVETPATDAFLLNVQADGVVKVLERYSFRKGSLTSILIGDFAKELRAQAEALKGGE